MKVCKIGFILKQGAEVNDDTLAPIWDYLGCLYKNGQILRNYELVRGAAGLFAYATLPDADALRARNNSIYVNKCRDALLKTFDITQEAIGDNVNHGVACACEDPSWYMLRTDITRIESPVVCGDCGHAVPLYRLPYIRDEQEHYSAVSWQWAYKNVDWLWIDGLADRFTRRQLRDPHSQLSLEGRALCKAYAEKTGKAFYYYLFQNDKASKTCPVCDGEWKRERADGRIAYRCDACRVVADAL